MQIAILQTEDKSDMKLLSDLARKMGIKLKVLTEEEKEDIGMGMLLKEASRDEKISRAEVMKKLTSK